MSKTATKSTRRAFFLKGGAVLGAGVSAAAGASAMTSDGTRPVEKQLKELRHELDCAADRETIRQLHRSFMTSIEQQKYEAAAELFADHAHLSLSGASATGKSAILRLFTDDYRQQRAAVLHGMYRQNASQQSDSVTLSEDRLQATGEFHVEVELCTPLKEDCTAASMARLQGQMADRRWEGGRFEAQYVKTAAHWKIASLSYRAS
jgi:hypothetical protein